MMDIMDMTNTMKNRSTKVTADTMNMTNTLKHLKRIEKMNTGI